MARSLTGYFFGILILGAPLAASAGPIFIENKTASASRPLKISLASLLSTPAAQRKVTVTLPSPAAARQTLSMDLDGPKGTVVTFSSSMVTPKTPADMNPKKKLLAPGLIYTMAGQGKKKITLGESTSTDTGNSSNGYECGCLKSDNIDSIIQSFRSMGMNYTRAQVCTQFNIVPGVKCDQGKDDYGFGDIPFGGFTTLSAFVQRDACVGGGKKVGKAVLEFNLSKVPADLLKTGELIIKPTFSAFDGNKQTKLKKAGADNGKYAGIPLLLASPASGISFTGSLGEVHLTTYKKDQKISDKILKIADYIFYKSWLLWRVPLGGALKGGKGTFEIRGNQAGYSICADLVRKDQFFNGYPRNSE